LSPVIGDWQSKTLSQKQTDNQTRGEVCPGRIGVSGYWPIELKKIQIYVFREE
jgi:hypothetical protein